MADRERESGSKAGKNTENSTSDSTENESSEEEGDIYEVEKIVGMTTNKVGLAVR